MNMVNTVAADRSTKRTCGSVESVCYLFVTVCRPLVQKYVHLEESMKRVRVYLSDVNADIFGPGLLVAAEILFIIVAIWALGIVGIIGGIILVGAVFAARIMTRKITQPGLRDALAAWFDIPLAAAFYYLSIATMHSRGDWAFLTWLVMIIMGVLISVMASMAFDDRDGGTAIGIAMLLLAIFSIGGSRFASNMPVEQIRYRNIFTSIPYILLVVNALVMSVRAAIHKR